MLIDPRANLHDDGHQSAARDERRDPIQRVAAEGKHKAKQQKHDLYRTLHGNARTGTDMGMGMDMARPRARARALDRASAGHGMRALTESQVTQLL